MKKIFLTLLIMVPLNSFGNNDLIKINNLFDKGVLNEKSYLKSAKDLGLDVSSKEFVDILELYKRGSIEFDSFNEGIVNIISLQSNQPLSNIRYFKFGDCRGSSLLCNQLFNLPEEDLITEIPIDSYDTCQDAIKSFKEQEDIFDNATENQGWREMYRKLFVRENNFSVVINFIYFIPQYSRNVDVTMYIKGDLGTEENNCKDFSLYNLGIDVNRRNIGTIDLEEIF